MAGEAALDEVKVKEEQQRIPSLDEEGKSEEGKSKEGECKPKSRTPKVKGERKKKKQHPLLSQPPQLPLQQLLPPLLLPQPSPSRQEAERQASPEGDRLQGKPPRSTPAAASTPPMPTLDPLASETSGEEAEAKAHPSVQKLYLVQRPRKSSSQKKRMSCQEMLEKFLTQEKRVDLGIKGEESRGNPEGPAEPSKLQAAPRSDDITLWRIPKRERRELFKRVRGHPARYAAAVFSRMVPPDELRRWRGAVSYRGGRGKRALPHNVVARLRRLLHRQFWDIVAADWRRIRSEINKILGT
uniref:Uncharacterized protein n=1 Tax=Sphaerodactylus townsendi TaxID=933632 RepID=A0ACB8F264_9SAUR